MILSNTLAQDDIGPDIWKYTGSDISTEIIGWFENKQECMETALKFSIDNSIVESDEWANIILENGLDGAPIGSIPWNKGLTKETDERIRSYGQSVSHSTQGRIPWNKGKSNPSAADSGRKGAKKLSEKVLGRRLITLPDGKRTWYYPNSL